MDNTSKSTPGDPIIKLLSEFEPATKEQWLEQAEISLKGKPVAKLKTKTYEQIECEPIYFRQDAEGLSFSGNLPGYFPFLRGNDFAGKKLTQIEICEDLIFTEPKAIGQYIADDLNHSRFTVTIDETGNDLTHLRPEGNGFVPEIATFHDFEDIFRKINLEKTPAYLKVSYPAVAYASMLAAYMNKTGVASDKFHGGFLYDPIARFERRGSIPTGCDKVFELLKKHLEFCNKEFPEAVQFGVDATVYANAGASADQELAFALAKSAYIFNELVAQGAEPKDIARKMVLCLSIGQNFFMEIAKIRAARVLWAQFLKAYGIAEENCKITIHAFSAKINKTKLDPYNNLLRLTTECTSAIIAGADAIHLRPFDERYGLSNELSRQITRNVQNVLGEECNLLDAVDPAGGAWYVEYLTEELARRSWELFQKTLSDGDFIANLKSGAIAQAISKTAQSRIAALSTRKDVLVGINKYPNLNELTPKTLDIDIADLEKQFNARCLFFDNVTKEKALASVVESFTGKNHFVTALRNAAAAGACRDDLYAAMGCTTCDIEPIEPISEIRLAAHFETLRQNAVDYSNHSGHSPRVFIANVGTVSQYKARVDFTTDFFRTGGFEVESGTGYTIAEDAAKAIIDKNSPIAVICSSDDVYPTVVPDIARLVKGIKPDIKLVLAGFPADFIEQFKQSGIDEFIHIKANIYDILTKLQVVAVK